MEKEGRDLRDISPSPEYWCDEFIWVSIRALKNNLSYEVCYECIDYFLSGLPNYTREKSRKLSQMDDLLLMINKVLDTGSVSDEALKFAQILKKYEQKIRDKWAEGEQKMLAEKNK
jgi:hypothetical protein